MLGQKEIRATLPHRYPFLLVDRVLELSDDGSHIVALKNVSANEPFFQGHFPDEPIMPGVLIIEALAQAGGILVGRTRRPGARAGAMGVLAGVDGFRFRRPVRPGDALRLEVTLAKMRGAVGKLACRATVEGQLVADGEITFALADLSAGG
ncbi:MAG: 3-hydroxyacyl-ACP dehydratase FabZ [Chloroflexi bacterium]|nr:3-hydroxyacyl-ACP dehydratase FabZ [Chloroflexota bacterium]